MATGASIAFSKRSGTGSFGARKLATTFSLTALAATDCSDSSSSRCMREVNTPLSASSGTSSPLLITLSSARFRSGIFSSCCPALKAVTSRSPYVKRVWLSLSTEMASRTASVASVRRGASGADCNSSRARASLMTCLMSKPSSSIWRCQRACRRLRPLSVSGLTIGSLTGEDMSRNTCPVSTGSALSGAAVTVFSAVTVCSGAALPAETESGPAFC
ncbi:hypothetical protein NB703_003910 [Pantoea ananatis]|uniref:Uncharacterized protein n=1 Tax=Pantoea ananas TaxID=553 RepID=A0AAJ1D280_PANAN|nr:hypothetical protein [Pantoea ananatis]